MLRMSTGVPWDDMDIGCDENKVSGDAACSAIFFSLYVISVNLQTQTFETEQCKHRFIYK